ncbi:uncharacterized protein LOC118471043, partial [Tachysurus ichikawai]
MGQTTYEIHHPDKGKATQTYHINLLKEWKEPPSGKAEPVLLIQKMEEDQEEEYPEASEQVQPAEKDNTLCICIDFRYWQVPLEKTSRPYTAFRTPLGLYQFMVLPFGLHGAPATFQRLMDQVLQGAEEWSAACLDDVVVHSETWADHLSHLEWTPRRIQEAGLTLSMAKCAWAKAEVDYLG